MPNYGTHDFSLIDLGPQLSPERAAALNTSAGVSFGEILRALNAAMAAVTDNVDPLVRALTVQTTEERTDTELTGEFRVEYGSEYAVAMPQVSGEISHLLSIRELDIATQFTEELLDNASLLSLMDRFDKLGDAFRRAHKVLTLDTLYNPTAKPVTENSLERSPKFIGFDADDPYYGEVTLVDGSVVSAPYSHYLRDTTANLLALIDLALVRAKSRGQVGPFDIVPSPNAADAITSLVEFVSAGDALVRPGMGAEEAVVDSNTYLGVLRGRNIRVRAPEDRIIDADGQAWFALVKTFGDNTPGNPIAWRYSEKYGLTPTVRSRSQYPLDYATAIHRSDFSVNQRFGAVLAQVGTAGTYIAPQIRGN